MFEYQVYSYLDDEFFDIVECFSWDEMGLFVVHFEVIAVNIYFIGRYS